MNKYDQFRNNFDLIDFAQQNFEVEQRGSRYFVVCPFHQESTASCMVEKDRWWCFGSCAQGGDSIDFLSRITGLDRIDVVESTEYENLPHIDRKPQKARYVRPVSVSLVKSYHATLMRRRDKLNYLYDRHFNKESIQRAYIGYGTPIDFTGFKRPRYSIPHFNNGKPVGMRYRLDAEYNDEDKYISHPGTKGVIYNMGLLQKYDNIVYCGSQLDAAVFYYRYGIPTIAPPSESTFDVEWIPLFNSKNVLIWLDNDHTGRESSLKVYRNIKNICNAQIYIWPNEFRRKDDTCDFLTKYGIDGVKEVLYEYGIG